MRGVVLHADLRKPLPIKDWGGAFDIVFCYQVLEHIPRGEQFAALSNLFQLVAPGGFLFIDTENSLCPYDRHDSHTWLVRLLSQRTYDPIIHALGKGLNFFEPSAGRAVQTRDYLSYDELFGAASVSGFGVLNSTMPHEDKKQSLRVLTGSDWLHDNILQYFDSERFSPISVLWKRTHDRPSGNFAGPQCRDGSPLNASDTDGKCNPSPLPPYGTRFRSPMDLDRP